LGFFVVLPYDTILRPAEKEEKEEGSLGRY
jgi:hypothetical protein